MIFVLKVLDKSSSNNNRIILIISALENNVRVIESAGHTLESKGSVGYRRKNAHLIYNFQKTYQK